MDRDGAFFVLGAAHAVCERLKLIWADMGYRGERLKAWIEETCGWKLEVVKRPSKWGRYPVDVEPPTYDSFHSSASSLGRGENLCVARTLSANE
jgi:transposase